MTLDLWKLTPAEVWRYISGKWLHRDPDEDDEDDDSDR